MLVDITWGLRRIKIHHSQIFLRKLSLEIFFSFLDKCCFLAVTPVKIVFVSMIIDLMIEEKINKRLLSTIFSIEN